jgi:hypothetical protein
VEDYVFQLLNVYKIGDVRQMHIHTAELSAPEPSRHEIEAAVPKLRKISINHQVLIKRQQNLFEKDVKHHVVRSINSLILFAIRINFVISGSSLVIYQFTRRAIKLAV